jgi:hemerythrin superfamily protein
VFARTKVFHIASPTWVTDAEQDENWFGRTARRGPWAQRNVNHANEFGVCAEEEFLMDVTKMLEADHRQVESLFTKIKRADGSERSPLLDELVSSLHAHMELEETILYPAMEPVTGDESVEEGVVEHDLGRKGLDELMRLAPDEPGFGAALESVKAGITHHVKEEEDEIFPKLRKQGASVLADIATPFMKKRLEVGLPMDANALSASSSKDELLAEAKSAGVEGAASMTKAQLAGALAEAMA